MEMGVLRWGLVIYVIASSVLVAMLWRSTGAENSFSQIGALFGALALAFFAIAPSLRQEERHSITTLSLFRDTERDALLFGPSKGPYQRQFIFVTGKFGLFTANGIEAIVAPEKEIELVEYVVMQSLFDQMRGSWTAETIDKPTVYGSGNDGQLFIGLTGEQEIWTDDRLKKSLEPNTFIKDYGIMNSSVSFPPNVKIERKNAGESGSVTSLIANDFTIDITIAGTESAPINEDIWGLLKLDHDLNKPDKYKMNSYIVFVQAKTAKLNRYPRLIKDYWIWYEKVAKAISRLDWSRTDRELVNEHTRALLWQGGPDMFERALEDAKSRKE